MPGEPFQTAILVTFKDEDIIEEAIGLAQAGGYSPVEIVTIKELRHGRFGIGEGKADLLREIIQSNKASHIIVDDSLSVSESYNLARYCGCEVVDREKLVLQIFAKRAKTEEAKLQVKLAELSYELPRVRESVKIQKLGEQPGMFGYGSYEVEKYFRSIKARMDTTKKKLARIESRRDLFRLRRKDFGLPTVSLAGYTSAGKTTLFNALTRSQQPVSPKIFSTLTTTTRRTKLNHIDILVSDTVGFISRLPHYMIEAFKSTLEELTYSDLILLVIDISEPMERFASKLEVCLDTLSELKVQDDKIMVVFNKADKLDSVDSRRQIKSISESFRSSVLISARNGEGLDDLKKEIEKHLISESVALIQNSSAEAPSLLNDSQKRVVVT
jgi:GTP-binding protein HflX